MIKNRLGMAALLTAALLLFSPAAKAYVVSFDFTSASYNVIGTIDITANNTSPVAITAINALVNGVDSTTIVPNPFPLSPHQTSPDGLWFYDNIGYSGNPHLDNDGLLFKAGLYEYNIYADANIPAGSRPETLSDGYFIWRSLIGGGYNGPLEAGTLVATSAPELSTWAMMLIGFAGIGFIAYRRAKKSSAVAAVG